MANVFKCESCERSYPDEAARERHIQNIHGEKLFPCDRCDQSFVRKYKLKEHLLVKHIRSRNFVCEICKDGFIRNGDLKVHVLNKHSDERPYKCAQCDISFKRTGDFNRHKKTHDPTKHEQCPVCMKNFKSKQGLKNCLESHSIETQEYILCTWDGCKASLKSPLVLKEHIR